jgi:uroporphyrin-3 C-methyltransferase
VALHIWGREQALSDAKNEVDDGVDREQQEPLPEPAAGADPVAGDAAGAGADTATAGEASPASARSLMLGANATPVAWLALLLVLIVAGAGFMARSDAQRREADLMQRIQALESSSGLDTTTFDQMRDNLERRIELELEGLSDREQRLSDTQQRALQAQQQELADALERLERIARDAAQDTRSELGQRVDTLQRQLQQQSQRIADVGVEERQSWMLAEAQYLLRLASQRLIMTGDTDTSARLLQNVDAILRELAAPDLHGLRGAVAADLAAVRSVPRLDLEGLYLRVDALIRRTDDLVLFQMPEAQPRVEPPEDADWQERLRYGWDTALEKLSNYIVVSRRDEPVEALMDPQYESLVRQNMRMLLEQAQVALLAGDQAVYQQSLERAAGWVAQFFKEDEQAARAMADALAELAAEPVSVELPDLSASMDALDQVMRQRLAGSGA